MLPITSRSTQWSTQSICSVLNWCQMTLMVSLSWRTWAFKVRPSSLCSWSYARKSETPCPFKSSRVILIHWTSKVLTLMLWPLKLALTCSRWALLALTLTHTIWRGPFWKRATRTSWQRLSVWKSLKLALGTNSRTLSIPWWKAWGRMTTTKFWDVRRNRIRRQRPSRMTIPSIGCGRRKLFPTLYSIDWQNLSSRGTFLHTFGLMNCFKTTCPKGELPEMIFHQP
mmetsp:Transcript_2843/g.3885  ORF Transcript_2843/g.3885 Transcript_2843/m.3885 type:complete len:226 (-) Transcript_2843:124-801(-)